VAADFQSALFLKADWKSAATASLLVLATVPVLPALRAFFPLSAPLPA
jgi:hypothetical protein